MTQPVLYTTKAGLLSPVATCREFRQVRTEGAREVAKAYAEVAYAQFNKAQIAHADQLESDFDLAIKLLPKQPRKNKNT